MSLAHAPNPSPAPAVFAVTFDPFPAGLVPFHDLTAAQIALLVLVYGVTATIRGAFGFGAVAPAIIFSSMILEPHHAVMLALATGVWAQAQIVPFGLRNGDWKLARPLLLAGFAAIATGVFVFKKLEPGWLTICLGVAMLLIALADRYRLLDRLATRVDLKRFSVALGLSTVSGLVAGIAGGGGMYLYSVYLRVACPTPTLMRGTSILIGSIFLFWRFLVAIVFGLVSWRLMVESVLLLPVSMIGAWFGIRFFHRADARRFYGAFQLVLMLGAAVLLWKGFVRIA
ncbi:MAG: TSUP family transporter [Alphaproteobacteria bacterium]|jgi:uncharacterized membrane protein YfcA|nr:TSUP family transporter [Alphaproteobacteria bacterium]